MNNLQFSIPKTEFNPRFHAAASETQYHPLTTSYLYNWQKQRETKKNWNIHDLPMMVHERLHVGHFYNKTIKDVINRYKVLKGFKVDFSMGNIHYKKDI
jgi:isoleucyl-tRNA synthetase